MLIPPARCQVDESIERRSVGDVQFPLGVYPVEEMEPAQGYRVEFEPADGGDEDDPEGEGFGGDAFDPGVSGPGDGSGTAPGGGAFGDDDGFGPGFGAGEWERWPDRYVYDIVLSCERVPSLVRHLLSLMPGRVFPIFDFIGHDAYREIDPYISYTPLGLDGFMDGIRRYRPFFFEDGMCGFGAMSDDPFIYLFVDEHKVVTVRAEPDLRERVERVLEAFDLPRIENPAGADAATHEHRGVLLTPEGRPDLLSAEEIVEALRDEWVLTLNVDPDANIDDEGRELGLTAWRCLMRCDRPDEPGPRFGEVLLFATCLAQAEELAFDALIGVLVAKAGPDGEAWPDPVLLAADRATPEQLAELVRAVRRPSNQTPDLTPDRPRVLVARLLDR